MKGNFQILFDAVYEDIFESCKTFRSRVHLADALIAKDDFLSGLDDYSKDILRKNLVACLHLAYTSRCTVIIATDKDSGTARARFWSPSFEFLTKEMIALDFLIVYATSITFRSQGDVVEMTIDYPISFS